MHEFISNLILYTAGLAVALFWIAIFVTIGIEIHDAIFGDPTDSPDKENDRA